MKILIVDDSLDNRLLLQTLLKSAGYGDVLMAASAREALSRLGVEEGTPVSFRTLRENAARAGPEDVDLILMDFMRSEEQRLNSSHVAISYAVFCLKKKRR